MARVAAIRGDSMARTDAISRRSRSESAWPRTRSSQPGQTCGRRSRRLVVPLYSPFRHQAFLWANIARHGAPTYCAQVERVSTEVGAANPKDKVFKNQVLASAAKEEKSVVDDDRPLRINGRATVREETRSSRHQCKESRRPLRALLVLRYELERVRHSAEFRKRPSLHLPHKVGAMHLNCGLCYSDVMGYLLV